MICKCQCHNDIMDAHIPCSCCIIGGGPMPDMGSMVQCMQCNEILVSATRHNIVQCACDNKTTVDGGYSYTRVLGKDLHKIKVLKAYQNGKLVHKA
jgi:hypothetical protein